MRKIISLCSVFILLITSSCTRRSEKDYVGNYKTFYATKIELGNAVTGLLFDRGSKPEITAKSFSDLGEISIELFEGQNGLHGEGYLVVKRAQNMSFNPIEEVKKMSLDFSNFRMKGDTLVFFIENEIWKFEGKKLKGMIVKNESGIYVGLDKVTGINIVNGPFDEPEKDGMQFLKCVEKAKAHALATEFFKKQEKELLIRIKNEPKPNAKKVLENSLSEVRKQMTSFAL